ncbi:conserved Plasmodium protein, unknown function [Plasmodium gallinaceum]|uniref:HIT-type domain-containing protein n=1 Tax=Plasmodium gallinaceum TaxID=5849 RepID=A0A1J1GW74_PLAGA|nr:conserved Plasmodium protein, unknown function [Plasmodium gallinaceum]CRG96718.1 conserved Plasmodium protein, unknown function [Plasmodium gallinaceum]
MDEYEYNYSCDLENYPNNFENNVSYHDINYLNVDRTFDNFGNDLYLCDEAIEEDNEKEYFSSLNNNNLLKNEKELEKMINNNSIIKKRKICNDSIFNNKKVKNNENLCIICLKNEKKYKFTCCYEYYCSLQCFNKHNKKDCCKKKKKKLNEIKNTNSDNHGSLINNNFYVLNNNKIYESNEDYTEDNILTEEQKYKLKEDLELKLLLKNKYVRSIFKQFTSSNDKISYLSHYINDPTIIQVIDQIMKTIDN